MRYGITACLNSISMGIQAENRTALTDTRQQIEPLLSDAYALRCQSQPPKLLLQEEHDLFLFRIRAGDVHETFEKVDGIRFIYLHSDRWSNL